MTPWRRKAENRSDRRDKEEKRVNCNERDRHKEEMGVGERTRRKTLEYSFWVMASQTINTARSTVGTSVPNQTPEIRQTVPSDAALEKWQLRVGWSLMTGIKKHTDKAFHFSVNPSNLPGQSLFLSLKINLGVRGWEPQQRSLPQGTGSLQFWWSQAILTLCLSSY